MTPGWQTLDVRGTERRYLLAEPPMPASCVIFCLHGTRSQATDQLRLSRLAQLATDVGVVVVFPQALVPIGRGYEWDHELDQRFLDRLVDVVCGQHPAAGGKVCMTGMSGGARMSCHFASLRPEVVSLVGAIAGLRAPSIAALARPVPVYAFHGTSDRINPYQGSGTSRWYESVPDAARQWAVANGITSQPSVVQVSANVSRTSYGDPGASNEVVLWTAAGAGHTWPGTRLGPLLRLFLGKTTIEIDATTTILASPHLRATPA